MHVHVTAFYTQKDGNEPGEYEDAFWVSRENVDGDWEGSPLRAAVADGASEAFLAGSWAHLLARRFARAPEARKLAWVIGSAIRAWPRVVDDYVAYREENGKPIAWFEEAGLAKGSYATVVGCQFRDLTAADHTMSGPFDAWALGDACMFQIRDDKLIAAFPNDESSQFGYSPALAASRPSDPSLIRQHIKQYRSDWQSGDSFYLVTDAVAHWFLLTHESGGAPWRILGDLGTRDGPDSFAEWIGDLRKESSIHNDDCTVVRIDFL